MSYTKSPGHTLVLVTFRTARGMGEEEETHQIEFLTKEAIREVEGTETKDKEALGRALYKSNSGHVSKHEADGCNSSSKARYGLPNTSAQLCKG